MRMLFSENPNYLYLQNFKGVSCFLFRRLLDIIKILSEMMLLRLNAKDI